MKIFNSYCHLLKISTSLTGYWSNFWFYWQILNQTKAFVLQQKRDKNPYQTRTSITEAELQE